MCFVGIVETSLVSGNYYNVGGSEGCRTNDGIAFVHLREHSALRLERTSKAVLRSYIFLWGNIFVAKRGGKNKKQLWFKGIGEYRKNKIFKFFNVNLCPPYCFMFSEIRQTLYGIRKGSTA
jgi:hypothetical protein